MKIETDIDLALSLAGHWPGEFSGNLFDRYCRIEWPLRHGHGFVVDRRVFFTWGRLEDEGLIRHLSGIVLMPEHWSREGRHLFALDMAALPGTHPRVVLQMIFDASVRLGIASKGEMAYYRRTRNGRMGKVRIT